MDDLLSEFLTETHESLDTIDVELVKFEQDPNNAKMLDNIFRLVHTIKGTCGFLGLPRLEALAHSAENLMGKYRDGSPVTEQGVTLILQSIDRIKSILVLLGETGEEPEGKDADLIDQLDAMASCEAGEGSADEPPDSAGSDDAALVVQELDRPLKAGEVSLDDLERAFMEADGPDDFPVAAWTPDEDVVATDKSEPVAEVETPVEQPEEPAKPVAAKVEPKSEAKPEAKAGAAKGGVQNQSLRVNVETLEHLITMVSELVLTRNQLLEISRRHEDSEFKVPLQRLSNVTAELQEGVLKTRMQPIGNAWQKLPRIVRDLGNELDKEIELDMVGAETELDRQVLDLIKDPLTHMVRNSADHGLEMPDDREASGKPRKGLIRLSAYHEGGHIIISIADDGKGLNSDRIKEKVLEKGLASEAELDKMSEQQIHRFIMGAGFSTAQAVTAVSGRGVGMDVVRTNIELIGGSIDLKSIQGEGTTFTIKIPLTLAIVSALIVESSAQKFAIPQLAVVELVRAQSNSDHKIERIKDTPVLRLRNKLLPLVSLREVLGLEALDGSDTHEIDETALEESGFIVVTQVGDQIFGIVVDGVFHTEEIVVKPMSTLLRDITTFSGNTILGDGSVIMIIDPNGIAQTINSEMTDKLNDADDMQEAAKRARDMTSLLIFSAGSDEPKAVPLSLVTRLEEIDVARIERSNGRCLVQYRGGLMPLVYVSDQVEPRESGTQPLLVFSDNGRSMALAIDQIIDIVEEELKIEVGSSSQGVIGSAVIKGKATEILDLAHYLPLAFDDWFQRQDMSAGPVTQRLMLIDDSAFFRNMLAPVLKSAGYTVDTFVNGREALLALEDGAKYDLIISDIEMPEMNGFELAERLSSTAKYKSLPIIALSSHTVPAAIERGRQAGFSEFVAKFDRQGLLATLQEMREGRAAA